MGVHGFRVRGLAPAPRNDSAHIPISSALRSVLLRMRIEAASFKGRLVSFSTGGPWIPQIQPGDTLALPTRANLAIGLTYVGFLLLLGAAVFLSWRNYSRGRGDAQGSWRLAAATSAPRSVG